MTQATETPPNPRKRLETLLARGEVVRWSGGPDPALAGAATLSQRLGALVPAGFGVMALLIGAALAVLPPEQDYEADQAPLAIAGLGGLVLAYGLARLVQQAHARRRAGQRFYAVTDRRVIAIDGASAVIVAAHALRGVMPLAHADGSGELLVFYRPDGVDTQAPEATLAFQDVPAIDRACRAVEALARHHGVDISDAADD